MLIKGEPVKKLIEIIKIVNVYEGEIVVGDIPWIREPDDKGFMESIIGPPNRCIIRKCPITKETIIDINCDSNYKNLKKVLSLIDLTPAKYRKLIKAEVK